MKHGWKTRLDERRYFEEKKKAQQEAALTRARMVRQWEFEMELHNKLQTRAQAEREKEPSILERWFK